nr:T9SS type A sorting domain-containing protein [Prolixibacteraceae bacterium]
GYTVNDINLEMTNQHTVGKCIFMRVYFTIDNNVPIGQQITNCAHFDGQQNNLTLNDACVSFTAEEGEPRPCLNKEICDVQTDYEPGDTLRFKLRIQNIGSATMTGASIQDALNANFSYVGNESYYQASSYNVPCSSNGQIPANTTAWQGVTTSHGGNNLSWNLPDIASDCQLFYVGFCSYYGTWALPYYYIEFDAVVDSFAMPGVTPNEFEISGGNLPQNSTSNTVYALVVASLGQEISKQVSSDNGSNYANSATVAPGSNARYRLSYTNTSNIPLSDIEMVDLLAFNDNSDDWLILNRNTARGSEFGVGYTGNHSTSLQPTGTIPSATIDFSTGDNLCLPNFGVNVPGCTTASWNTTPDKNVRMNFGTFSLSPAQALNEDFDVSVASSIGHDSTSCNDFAARASANFLLNGAPQSVTLTPIAAPSVCITTDTLQPNNCCEMLELYQEPDLNCCVQLISEKCEVDSIVANIDNGTFASASWNCSTPIQTGYAQQSTFTFYPGACYVNMTTCFNQTDPGSMIILYTVYFANGEVCKKEIEIECDAPTECCDQLELYQEPDLNCCVQLISEDCKVDSIVANIDNGTFASAGWNCSTSIQTGYAQQSTFTFYPGACNVSMTNCFNQTDPGSMVTRYIVYFANGEVCMKEIELECDPPTECCDQLELYRISEDRCCVRLTSEDCKVDSIVANIDNGTFTSAGWNCSTSIQTGYAQQSTFTFYPGACNVSMTNCFNQTDPGSMVISYTVYFANGEVCMKEIELECDQQTSECCPILDFKLRPAWPARDTYVGYFSITNPASSPICSVEINPLNNGTFSTGNLWVDGNLSGQSWTSSNIPASGNLSPVAYNALNFTMNAHGYNGEIEVCIIMCDGTVCCFEVNWNKQPISDLDVEAIDINIDKRLLAVSVSPYISTDTDEKVKYVSFGYFNEDEASEESEFFAASTYCSDFDDNETSFDNVSMGRHNAFFELSNPYTPAKDASLPRFNLVFAGRMPEVACTLFNEEGNIIYSGSIDITAPDTSTTSIITPELGSNNKNEILKLYPNPNNSDFTVTFSTGSPGNVTLQVVNNVGQILKSEEWYIDNAGIHEHIIKDLNIADGVNHVILKNGQTTRTKAFIRKE